MKQILKPVQRMIQKHPSIHRALRSLWTPPQSVYQHLSFHGPFGVQVEPGVSFQAISYGDVVENELFWRGYAQSWEPQSLRLWASLVKSADFIVDVGANTGIYALAASAIRPNAKVLAVEPSPRVFARLQRNIELNGFPISATEVAVSDREGSATFYDFPDDHEYSASLEPDMGGTIETTVPVTKLDTLLHQYDFPRVDLMKLDIEKHEPAALRGMHEFLERSPPVILVEVLDENCRQSVGEALAGLNYEWSSVADERNFLLTPF